MTPWVILATAAVAGDPALHQQEFAASRAAEAEGDFERALSHCVATVEADPTGPRTPSCERRAAFLERRRDHDGGFVTLSMLQDIRRRFRTEAADGLRQEVAALQAREGMTEVLAAELAIWLGRDALVRLEDPVLALDATREAYARMDALQLEPALQRQTVELHSVTLARLGRSADALAVEQAIRIPTDMPRLTPVEQVLSTRMRSGVAVACTSVIALFGVLSLRLSIRGWRVRPTPLPMGIVVLLVAAGGAGLLASAWAQGAGRAAPWILLGAAAVHLVTVGALVALAERPWARRSMRGLAAVTTFAVGYLAMWATNTLTWVGL